jgi:hypothetical protein
MLKGLARNPKKVLYISDVSSLFFGTGLPILKLVGVLLDEDEYIANPAPIGFFLATIPEPPVEEPVPHCIFTEVSSLIPRLSAEARLI